MTYTKSQTRKFVIPQGPSVSDPAWVVACTEIFEPSVSNPAGLTNPIQYSNFVAVFEALVQAEYERGRIHGESMGRRQILETLGIRQEIYDELKRLKDIGSAVLVYAKVSDPIEFASEDNAFITGVETSTQTIASGMSTGFSTSYGSSTINVPQGPGAGTASGASVAEGTYKPREYDTGDPWKDSLK